MVEGTSTFRVNYILQGEYPNVIFAFQIDLAYLLNFLDNNWHEQATRHLEISQNWTYRYKSHAKLTNWLVDILRLNNYSHYFMDLQNDRNLIFITSPEKFSHPAMENEVVRQFIFMEWQCYFLIMICTFFCPTDPMKLQVIVQDWGFECDECIWLVYNLLECP